MKELVQLFEIHPNTRFIHAVEPKYVNLGFMARAATIHRLNKRVHQYKPGSVSAATSVRDLAGRGIFERMGLVEDSHVGLFLAYDESVDLGQAYQDLQALNLEGRARLVGVGIRDEPFPSHKVLLDSCAPEHSLMFHANAGFYQRSPDGPKMQKNELYISGKGDPSPETAEEIKELCKGREVTCEVKCSGPSGIITDRNIMSSYLHPHFIIRAEWDGTNFDNKGINLYGKIRELVLDTHIKESVNSARQEMERLYRSRRTEELDSIYLNQEGINDGPMISDLRCGLTTHVPFEHKGKSMEAIVSYPNFRGTSWW